MTNDPADLSHLAAIAVPPPVPWWPLAPGWWVLAGALLGAIGILAVFARRRYRRNAYRRAALAELTAIGPIKDAAGAAAVSVVLKRTALIAYGRTEVASLSGPAWCAFLDHAVPTGDFINGPASGLTRMVLGGPIADGVVVVTAARRWVRQHRVKD